jgi:hypothetical protein
LGKSFRTVDSTPADWWILFFIQDHVFGMIVDWYNTRQINPKVKLKNGEKEKELAIKAQVQAYRTAMEPKRFIRPLINTYLCKQLEE